MVAEIVSKVVDGVAQIELCREQAINALSTQMLERMRDLLHSWATDDSITEIELHGRGPKGFCAGGDVREIREYVIMGQPEKAVHYLETEYEVDLLIAEYPKPVTSFLHGVSMGGGLGIGIHTTKRYSTNKLSLAMPEVGIGFFPDVGVRFELSRCSDNAGVWMAMTGLPIGAADAKTLGLIDQITGGTDPNSGVFEANRDWIRECFAGDDPVEILHRLENHSNPNARSSAQIIRSRSPFSVAVALAGVREAEGLADVRSVIESDTRLAHRLAAEPDFVEGVRAQLVDKDYNPKWRHDRLEDVDLTEVEDLFADNS